MLNERSRYFIIKLKDPNNPIELQYQTLFKTIDDEGLEIKQSIPVSNEIHFLLDKLLI